MSKLKLPKTVEIELTEFDDIEHSTQEELELAIGDLISDKVGFCHYGFKYEICDGKVRVYDIDWDIGD